MKRDAFDQFKNFTLEEVQRTGAFVPGLRFMLFDRLQTFRNLIFRRVLLLKHGLNSGTHVSVFHNNGLAVDFTLDPSEGPVDVNYIVALLIQVGFKGVGVYWNGEQWSFHADLRSKGALWKQIENADGQWESSPLLSSDPLKLFS
jgi:hypothetical protein